MVGTLVDEARVGRRRDRREGRAVRAHLDVEFAGIEIFALTTRAGMLDHEAIDRPRRAKIHLQERAVPFGAPAVGLPSGHAAVHRLLGSLVGTAGRLGRRGTAKGEVLPSLGSVDLELEDSGDIVAP